MQLLQKPKEGLRFSKTGVADSCELPCGCWELNPGPLQEQQVLFPGAIFLGPSLKLLTNQIHFKGETYSLVLP